MIGLLCNRRFVEYHGRIVVESSPYDLHVRYLVLVVVDVSYFLPYI